MRFYVQKLPLFSIMYLDLWLIYSQMENKVVLSTSSIQSSLQGVLPKMMVKDVVLTAPSILLHCHSFLIIVLIQKYDNAISNKLFPAIDYMISGCTWMHHGSSSLHLASSS